MFLNCLVKGSLNSFKLTYTHDVVNVQEVSSMLLEKLVAAGIGDRPVVFVTHRYVYYIAIIGFWYDVTV